jgi:hypothetical protein
VLVTGGGKGVGEMVRSEIPACIVQKS